MLFKFNLNAIANTHSSFIGFFVYFIMVLHAFGSIGQWEPTINSVVNGCRQTVNRRLGHYCSTSISADCLRTCTHFVLVHDVSLYQTNFSVYHPTNNVIQFFKYSYKQTKSLKIPRTSKCDAV